MPKTAVIIGAGPAGLTAALELLERTDIIPVVFEADDCVGGISRTVNYKGNRIDIGGHRFFSRSDEIMDWWNRVLPVEDCPGGQDNVMLVRSRLSRIYYGSKFYNYPVTLSWQTISNLGLLRMIRIGFSYLHARIRPRPETSLEDFYINRFGRELYETFFRDYTEKVWGVPCRHIAPSWGAQRVKGLSVSATLAHAVKTLWGSAFHRRRDSDLRQEATEVSLIDRFLYPKYGPGQMWEAVADMVRAKGGQVHLGHEILALHTQPGCVTGVEVRDSSGTRTVAADYVLSTMPVKDLVGGLTGVEVPAQVIQIAGDLPYRDFFTVGLLLKRFGSEVIEDNWLYIQQPEITMGRIQVFNNWSPAMVADPSTTWVGLEYFANEGDDLWNRSDSELIGLGIDELGRMGLVQSSDVLDSTLIRMRKTYPAYFGSYENFDIVREFLDGFENLFLLGRNGQHRYNNMDHSMMTAIRAVDAMKSGSTDKTSVWDVNTDQDYHEER